MHEEDVMTIGERDQDEVFKFSRENGYISGGRMPDGRYSFVLAGVTNGQIITCDDLDPAGAVSERYSYISTVEAHFRWVSWALKDYEGEPENWIRHQPSDRRREYGDPAKETIRP